MSSPQLIAMKRWQSENPEKALANRRLGIAAMRRFNEEHPESAKAASLKAKPDREKWYQNNPGRAAENSRKGQAVSAKSRFGRAVKCGKMQAGENNINARVWHLRSPRGRGFHFRNLVHFIRTNPDLFTDDQIRWKTRGNSPRNLRCNAVNGLSSLNPNNKRVQGSWRGWTWLHSDSNYSEQNTFGTAQPQTQNA